MFKRARATFRVAMKDIWIVASILVALVVMPAPSAAAHACGSGDPNSLCEDTCPPGEYHDHRFVNQPEKNCHAEPPCNTPACNTIEGLCKDFPALVVCNDLGIECLLHGGCRWGRPPLP